MYQPSRGSLYRVSVQNGRAELLADPDSGRSYTTPEVLPGGRAVLYTSWRATGERGVYSISLETREKKLLVKDAVSPRYATGHLLYATPEGVVFRRPFDARSLRFTGDPTPVLTGVSLVGRAVQVTPSAALFDSTAIWVFSFDDSTFTRVASGHLGVPEWTPDGRRISYAASSGGRGVGIYTVRADGSGAPSLLYSSDGAAEHHAWSADGRWLVFRHGEMSEAIGGRTFDLWRLDLAPSARAARRAQPVVSTPADERQPAVSPDGRWLAYISNESGTYEVYVHTLGEPGGRVPVSAGGGLEPRWSRDGAELFYRSGAALVSARVRSTPTFGVISRDTLFRLADPPSIFGTN